MKLSEYIKKLQKAEAKFGGDLKVMQGVNDYGLLCYNEVNSKDCIKVGNLSECQSTREDIFTSYSDKHEYSHSDYIRKYPNNTIVIN